MPSPLVIFIEVFEKTKSISAEITIIARSIIWKLDCAMPPKITTGTPNTRQILKILLPIILPTSKSCSPFFAETMVVTSSGRDVPNAIIVKEMMRSLTPRASAILEALSTTKSLPITIAMRPIRINSNSRVFSICYFRFLPCLLFYVFFTTFHVENYATWRNFSISHKSMLQYP